MADRIIVEHINNSISYLKIGCTLKCPFYSYAYAFWAVVCYTNMSKLEKRGANDNG